MDTGHWILSAGVTFTEETFGFIYVIVNTTNNKKYIGKKQCFKKVKRAPLKFKKRKRIEQKDSDWKTYTSSSNDLNEDILKQGKDSFTFTILKACSSKWELAYEEIKEQIVNNVLLTDEYYNGIINVRIGTPPKLILENFKKTNK